MKIIDLEKADIMRSETFRVLDYPQKYLRLEHEDEIYELEISDITSTAFYLKIKKDEEK